jgi:hypothetical protein
MSTAPQLNACFSISSPVQPVTYGDSCQISFSCDAVRLKNIRRCSPFDGGIIDIGQASFIPHFGVISKVPLSDIISVATANLHHFFLTGNGSIYEFSENRQRPHRRLCSILHGRHRDICVSTDFDLFAVAALEQNVLFYSLSSGVFRHRESLGGEVADEIQITDGLGMVIVTTRPSIHVLNVNGFLIRRMRECKERRDRVRVEVRHWL